MLKSSLSATLRVLAERLSGQRDATLGVLSRPQAGLSDFYREMGALFGVQLSPHNRWAGFKVLRERRQAHIDAALFRPVLIVDETQEMVTKVLAELRLLASARLDSHILLTVVLAGDGRLLERFRTDELLPLGSGIRVRLTLERATPEATWHQISPTFSSLRRNGLVLQPPPRSVSLGHGVSIAACWQD